jgi:hypothetical protein
MAGLSLPPHGCVVFRFRWLSSADAALRLEREAIVARATSSVTAMTRKGLEDERPDVLPCHPHGSLAALRSTVACPT